MSHQKFKKRYLFKFPRKIKKAFVNYHDFYDGWYPMEWRKVNKWEKRFIDYFWKMDEIKDKLDSPCGASDSEKRLLHSYWKYHYYNQKRVPWK